MLGHRGYRLGIVYQSWEALQAQYIFEAAAKVQSEGIKVRRNHGFRSLGFPQGIPETQLEVIHRVARKSCVGPGQVQIPRRHHD